MFYTLVIIKYNMEKTQKSNKKLILVIIGIVFVCILCGLVLSLLGFLGLFTYKQEVSTISNNQTVTEEIVNTTTNSTSTTNNTEFDQEMNESTTSTFVGKFVIANLPEGWHIKEYSDKNGMSAFADTGEVSFSGLTGLEITDENNSIVFTLKGIDGIGGAGGCLSLVEFQDTQASYVQSIKTETEALEIGTTTIVNLKNAEYVDINTLNHRFRRVNNVLYYAKDFSSYFNTACGIDAQIIKLDELSFTIKDGTNTPYTANAYKFGITPTITSESTLEKLDYILISLKAKNIS